VKAVVARPSFRASLVVGWDNLRVIVSSTIVNKIYLNLGSGLSALRSYAGPYSVVRIQSTACEQKRWAFVLEDLDYGFLVDVGLGHEVCVVDASARCRVPRALAQGVEWITYALSRRWLGRTYEPVVRGCRCGDYFDAAYRQVGGRAIKKLDYVAKLTRPTDVRISHVSFRTDMDGKYDCLGELLRRSQPTVTTSTQACLPEQGAMP
jgi:hypothetical protein